MDTNKLIEARARAWEAAKSILDTAEAEDRTADGEVEQAWQKAMQDVDTIDARLKAFVDAETRNQDIEKARRELGITAPTENRTNTTEDELRSFLRGERRDVVVPPERRDLTKGTATAGGNTVPTSFYNQLVAHLIEVSGIMMAGPTVLTTTGGESIEVPVTTAHGSGALTAEAAAISESDPAFVKRTLGAYKYATAVQISRELVDDTAVDLLGYIAMQAGRAVGNALGTDLAVGNASSKPSGITQTSTAGVTGATSVAGVFTADNLIDLFYSVIAPYRNSPSCAWLMRDASMGAVRKLKDTTNQYLFQPSLVLGTPDTLLGKPVYTDPNIAATATSAKSVVFGDISQYFVRLAGGVRFERSDEYAFLNDLVTFKCVVRGDGILADQTGAVKHFVGGAT